jgi:uncharacterized membrane protein YfcA
MHDLWILVFIFIISLTSNAINGAVSGGASLFGVSFMLLLGIPPHLTMATYTMGSLPARLSAMWGYRGSGKILWKYVPLFATLGFIASLIGASLLVHTNQNTVSTIVGLALIMFIPLAFIKLRKGVEHITVSRNRWIIGCILYFILAAWTSFFAAWTGILCLFLYLYFFGFTILEIKATESVAGMATATGAIIIFLSSGVFNPWYVAAYIPGAIIGAYIGAKVALKLGNTRLRALVWLSISAISIKTVVEIKALQYLQQLVILFH